MTTPSATAPVPQWWQPVTQLGRESSAIIRTPLPLSPESDDWQDEPTLEVEYL